MGLLRSRVAATSITTFAGLHMWRARRSLPSTSFWASHPSTAIRQGDRCCGTNDLLPAAIHHDRNAHPPSQQLRISKGPVLEAGI